MIESIRATEARVSHLTIEQRAAARVPCALLGRDGACTIHVFRPIGCRSWTSFDREACDAALRDARPGHTGPQDHANYVAAGCLTEGLQLACGDAGLMADHREFHAALLVALTRPDAVNHFVSGGAVFDECPRVISESLRTRGHQAGLPPE
ncbi:MAG: hypothetical protein JNG88_13700 [Phycisphaerales bacterium]|nr:hypothetical protein [Phycisphaerales bacterium]